MRGRGGLLALAQRERRVAIGDEDEGVADHAVVPAGHAFDEREDAARIATGEQDREPRADDEQRRGQVEEEQGDVVRDGEEPLDERQPAVEVAFGVGVGDVEVHPLVLVGRGVAVAHQREVRPDPVAEAQQLQVPVEPPARVLLAEEDHQQRRQEQQPRAADDDRLRVAAGVVVAAARIAADAGRHDRDRDHGEDPKRGGEPVQGTVGIVDREPDRMVLMHLELLWLALAAFHQRGRCAPCSRSRPSGWCCDRFSSTMPRPSPTTAATPASRATNRGTARTRAPTRSG